MHSMERRDRKRAAPPWRAILVSSIAGLPHLAFAQGSGPPRGTEVILVIFLAGAGVAVLVASTGLFVLGKKALFTHRQPTLLVKFLLFVASVLVSVVAGIALMALLDIR